MPNPAFILLLAAVALAQPAPTPPPSVGTVRGPGPPPRIGVRLDEGPAGEWRITAVVPLSPAHRAGLKANDLILKVRGEEVSFDDPEHFRDLFAPSPVLMTIEREGEEIFFIVPKRVFAM